jgi:hypothetical protein
MPIRAQRWDVKHGLASVVLRVEHDAAQRGGWFPAMAPPSTGETLSWLEHSPSCCSCSGGKRGPRAAPSGGRVAEASFPA